MGHPLSLPLRRKIRGVCRPCTRPRPTLSSNKRVPSILSHLGASSSDRPFRRQLRSVLDDIDVRAIKTGMLFDAATTRAVARTLRAHYAPPRAPPPLVVDPVCVSTSGHTLLHPDALAVLLAELFPLAALVTPNKPEAELLLSHSQARDAGAPGAQVQIASLEDMRDAAVRLGALGPHAVLLKGGHVELTFTDVERFANANQGVEVVREGFLGENMEILQVNEADVGSRPVVVDLLWEKERVALFVNPRVDSTSTHGTGCTLSAAIASLLGKGESGM